MQTTSLNMITMGFKYSGKAASKTSPMKMVMKILN